MRGGASPTQDIQRADDRRRLRRGGAVLREVTSAGRRSGPSGDRSHPLSRSTTSWRRASIRWARLPLRRPMSRTPMPALRSSSAEPTTASTRRPRSDLLDHGDGSTGPPVAGAVDGDPAVVFALLVDPVQTLYLAVRSQEDGNIRLRARRDSEWGDVDRSLGAPPAGAASAPALASDEPVIRSQSSCAGATGSSIGCSAWTRWTTATISASASPSAVDARSRHRHRAFSWASRRAVWLLSNTAGSTVAAIRDDRVAHGTAPTSDRSVGPGGVTPQNLNDRSRSPDDPDPGVGITLHSRRPASWPSSPATSRRLLVSASTTTAKYFPIGGVLASPPAAVASYHDSPCRTDVAAIIDDHGRPGVWWRFNDGKSYTAALQLQPPRAPAPSAAARERYRLFRTTSPTTFIIVARVELEQVQRRALDAVGAVLRGARRSR